MELIHRSFWGRKGNFPPVKRNMLWLRW